MDDALYPVMSPALGPSCWIVRPPAKPRAAVAAVIDWLRWQAAGAGTR